VELTFEAADVAGRFTRRDRAGDEFLAPEDVDPHAGGCWVPRGGTLRGSMEARASPVS